MVARNMFGRKQLSHLIRKSPPGDIIVFALCAVLTVLVDMIAAVMAGVMLSALLFMRDIARMTHVVDISRNHKHVPHTLPEGWGVYKISGPLFFAAANHVFAELRAFSEGKSGIILYFDSVSIMDAGGLEELMEFMHWCQARSIELVIADVPYQPLKALVKAGIKPVAGQFMLYPTLTEAVTDIAISG
jgi:SulP family sulfate permease